MIEWLHNALYIVYYYIIKGSLVAILPIYERSGRVEKRREKVE